ncbi:MAG: MaoC family dehydratase [Alphaproteobacteria bacterium]|nr:MaoC family dehydratase [Alphaproteobacteria bacterium]
MDVPVNPGIEALYLEDFQVGNRYRSPAITVTERQIISYALDYDPQAFHIDVEAGRAHPFGQVFASGLHTLALSFRLFAESRVLAACAHAGMGMDKLRWRKPVMPGDTLHLELEVLSARPSDSRAGLGILVLRHDTVNQDAALVLTLECTHMIKRRPPG